jgi:hypothetical protein
LPSVSFWTMASPATESAVESNAASFTTFTAGSTRLGTGS